MRSHQTGSTDAIDQASSLDAAGGNTMDENMEDGKLQPSADPPAKRTRASRSGSNAAKAPQAGSGKIGDAQMPANAFEEGGGENGEAGSMRMEAPPPAGSVDPAGYKTNPAPQGRPVRVYADGVFDLFHLGHMRQLQQSKSAFPDTRLIVGVTGDAETNKRKGLTVMCAKDRAESVRHCRWVDEVIEDCPWILTVEFLKKHNIDYVAHDDLPYGANEGDDIYAPIKEAGMFLVTQRTEGVSTTGIITKIVRDYEQYVARQLKRGTSRQELNLSWLKKNELEIKRQVSELRNTIKGNWTITGQELGRDLRQFWQPSRPGSPTPSARNGTPGRTASLRSSSGAAHASGTATPGRERGKNADFAAGYAMGLIGGVKSWMQGSTRRSPSDSRAPSPSQSPTSSVEDRASPVDEGKRPRSRKMREQDQPAIGKVETPSS